MEHDVYMVPVDVVEEKRPPPSELTVVVVVVPPSPPSVKPEAAGCCGAVAVRTEPNVSPAPAGADDEVVATVVREKGVAEAVGLLKAKLKPVEAAEEAGVPTRKTGLITCFNRVKVEKFSWKYIPKVRPAVGAAAPGWEQNDKIKNSKGQVVCEDLFVKKIT